LSGSMPAARYWRATKVHVDPTGSLIKRIGCSDRNEPPNLWWSSTSMISDSSAPSTACDNSLWSTRTSWGLGGLTRSDLESTPNNFPWSSKTGNSFCRVLATKVLACAIGRVADKVKQTACTAEAMRRADLMRIVVVAVSWAQLITVTPFSLAN